MKKGYLSEDDDDDQEKAATWPAVRDLFDQIIRPCGDWSKAEIIAEPLEMAKHFYQAYPETELKMEDMRLALHDLNIPYERNEHNQKFYYLASWK